MAVRVKFSELGRVLRNRARRLVMKFTDTEVVSLRKRLSHMETGELRGLEKTLSGQIAEIEKKADPSKVGLWRSENSQLLYVERELGKREKAEARGARKEAFAH
ncbi:MAG TPA: hypothetical protein VFF09_02480 [archaeon]|nr:hypothetical protein [archaeon]